MSSIVILHFSPLELYPPIQNLLVQLERTQIVFTVHVITTQDTGGEIPTFCLNSNRIKIVRYGKSGRVPSAFVRYWNYLKFHGWAVWYLITINPKRVLYFETLSSFPVYIYKYLFRSSAEVLIHYHEYTSPKEYNNLKLMGFFHHLEKNLLLHAKWVSHTNIYRLEKFKEDIYPFIINNAFILPNYPPKSWYSPARQKIDVPVKIVHVGALSLSHMYTKEFARWVLLQNGKAQWDIYGYNITEDTKAYINGLNSDFIRIMPGVSYDELPMILKAYQIGVILYQGVIPNHVYSVSNKLYEYLMCGLGVWFPSDIIGSYEYVTENSYPEVVKLFFNKLSDHKIDSAIDRTDFQLKRPDFYCEDVLKPLINKLTT